MSSNTKQVSPLALPFKIKASMTSMTFAPFGEINHEAHEAMHATNSVLVAYLYIIVVGFRRSFSFLLKKFLTILFSSFQLLMALKKVYICVV